LVTQWSTLLQVIYLFLALFTTVVAQRSDGEKVVDLAQHETQTV
jgi:hypothetical protein